LKKYQHLTLLKPMMRLNRFLAQCGLGSRRKCEALIQAGRVAVNGSIVTSLSTTVDEASDIVAVDGRTVTPPERFVYILLNKPTGYVTTASDELGRKTVLDLVPGDARIFPVGRLDKDTSGALLLTNDGQLAYYLTHPRFEIDKVYHAVLDRPITRQHLAKLRSGILLDDSFTAPCQVRRRGTRQEQVEIVLHEGKKRQVRRMFSALGYEVVQLIRTQFGSLGLAGLKPGEWRYLTNQEVAALKSSVSNSNEQP